MRRYHHDMQQILINGHWADSSASTDGFQAIDPSTGETRDQVFPCSNWKDLDSMAEAAMAAMEMVSLLRALPVGDSQ